MPKTVSGIIISPNETTAILRFRRRPIKEEERAWLDYLDELHQANPSTRGNAGPHTRGKP